MATFTFLGTGTSGGVPGLGCHCEVCESHDVHDKRFRSVGLIETDTTRVLIDCGPDIRQQLMPLPFRKIDAVLLTHIHYDHVAGIDDLRPFCVFGDLQIYAAPMVADGLRHSMPYCFSDHLYPGVPRLALHELSAHHPIQVGDLSFTAFEVMHGKMPIYGYRVGHFAYITDMKSINDAELPCLEGVETLVVNALRWEKPHHSHQLVQDAIDFSIMIGARKTYLTHLTHKIGLHAQADKLLPAGFHFAYDGLRIEI